MTFFSINSIIRAKVILWSPTRGCALIFSSGLVWKQNQTLSVGGGGIFRQTVPFKYSTLTWRIRLCRETNSMPRFMYLYSIAFAKYGDLERRPTNFHSLPRPPAKAACLVLRKDVSKWFRSQWSILLVKVQKTTIQLWVGKHSHKSAQLVALRSKSLAMQRILYLAVSKNDNFVSLQLQLSSARVK